MSKKYKEYLAFLSKTQRIGLLVRDILLLIWLVAGLLIFGKHWTGGAQFIITICFMALFLFDIIITEKNIISLLGKQTKYPEYLKSSYKGIDILCESIKSDVIIKTIRFTFFVLVTYIMILLNDVTSINTACIYIACISSLAYLSDMLLAYVNAVVSNTNLRSGIIMLTTLFGSGFIGGFTGASFIDKETPIEVETFSPIPVIIHVLVFVIITAIILLLFKRAADSYKKNTFTDSTIGKDAK